MQAEIKGTTMPVLEVTLQQGEQLVSAHGELSWMTPNIQMSQHMSGGGAPQGHGQPHAGPEARPGRRRSVPHPLRGGGGYRHGDVPHSQP